MEIVEKKGSARVAVSGKLDRENADDIRQKLLELIPSVKKAVVLDMLKVESIDTMGLRLVSGLAVSCARNGLKFVIEVEKDGSPAAVCRAVGLDGAVEIRESEDG